MPTYYTFIPTSDTPTAETTAPDARHAKTAYLDYLSRSGLIAYSQRGSVRQAIKATKMEPGEFQTSVQLEYGVPAQAYEQLDESQLQEIDQQATSLRANPDQYIPPEQSGINIPASAGPVDMQFPSKKTNPLSNSPIANISRQSGGL